MSYWTGNGAGYSINEEVQLTWDKIRHDSVSHRGGDRREGGSCPPRPAKGATSISLVTVWALDMLCGCIISTVRVKGKEGKDAKAKQPAQEKSPVPKGTGRYLFIYLPQKTTHLPMCTLWGTGPAPSLLLIQIAAWGSETWTKQPQCIAGPSRPRAWEQQRESAGSSQGFVVKSRDWQKERGGRGSSSIFSMLSWLWGCHSSSCCWYSSPNYRQGLPLPSCCSKTFNFPGTVPARCLWWEKPLSYFDT